MISHFNLGTNDLPRAERFFDALFALLNGQQAYKSERTILYAFGEHSAKVAINTPFNGEPASAGNGSMVALGAADKAQVDAIHAKAMELGGSCVIAPAPEGGTCVRARLPLANDAVHAVCDGDG